MLDESIGVDLNEENASKAAEEFEIAQVRTVFGDVFFNDDFAFQRRVLTFAKTVEIIVAPGAIELREMGAGVQKFRRC